MSDTNRTTLALSTIAAFPLKQAWFCSECDVVVNQPKCPYCLTDNVHPLSTWLNRTEEKDPEWYAKNDPQSLVDSIHDRYVGVDPMNYEENNK